MSGRAGRFHTSPSVRALSGAVFGSGPGLVLPFAVSLSVGIGTQTDVYFFALSICLFATSILENTIHANAVTVLASAQQCGREQFHAAIRRILIGSTALAGAGFAVLALIGTFMITSNSGWSTQTQYTGVTTLWILTATVLASTVCSVFGAALYSTGAFFSAPATVAFRSVGALLSLPITAGTDSTLPGLAIGLATGEVVRLVFLGYAATTQARAIPQTGYDSGGVVPSLLKPAIPYAASISLSSATPVVDRAIGTSLGSGAVTTIDLAEKVFFVPLTVMWSSIVVVSGARWSHLAAKGEGKALVADFRRTVRTSSTVSFALVGLIAVALLVAAILIGPTFAGVKTSQIAISSLILLIGIPPAVVAALAGRYLSAARRTTVLPAFAATALAMSTVTSVLGAYFIGIYGIVVAATATRWVMAFAFYAACTRSYDRDPAKRHRTDREG